MPTFAEEIIYGPVPTDSGIVDEPNLLVTGIEKAGKRERKNYKNAKGTTYGLKYIEPTFEVGYTASVSANTGLANGHPGVETGAIANWATTVFGFRPQDGVTIYEDPTLSASNDGELPEISFNAVNFPFVIHPSVAANTITGVLPVAV